MHGRSVASLPLCCFPVARQSLTFSHSLAFAYTQASKLPLHKIRDGKLSSFLYLPSSILLSLCPSTHLPITSRSSILSPHNTALSARANANRRQRAAAIEQASKDPSATPSQLLDRDCAPVASTPLCASLNLPSIQAYLARLGISWASLVPFPSNHTCLQYFNNIPVQQKPRTSSLSFQASCVDHLCLEASACLSDR